MNILQSLLEYLKTRSIFLKLFDLVFILLLIAGVSTGYIFATNFTEITGVTRPVDEYQDFITVLENNKKVDEILEQVLAMSNGSRVGVYQFHDGINGFGRIPFFYYSQTFEKLKPGISSETAQTQRIPLSVDIELGTFADNRCYMNRKIEPATPNGHMMKSRGVISYARCPIFDLKDKLVGFVGVDYVNMADVPKDEKEETVLLQSLKRMTDLVAGALILKDTN